MYLLPLLLALLLQDPQSPPGVTVRPTIDATAKASWDALAKATFAEKPATAFDLHFHLRVRPDEIQSNDLTAHYQFLSPGFVRATLESGREHLRGPKGDYLIDGEESFKLVGREAAEDKKQIDEAVGVARNFLALTDPARLKPSSILPGASPEGLLPLELHERARGLNWINITTDGFHLLSSTKELPPGARRTQQALLGISGESPTLELAVVLEETFGADGIRVQEPQHILLDLQATTPLDSFQVPRHLRVHQLVPKQPEAKQPETKQPETKQPETLFRAKPTYELWLRGGTLRPEFGADAFLP